MMRTAVLLALLVCIRAAGVPTSPSRSPMPSRSPALKTSPSRSPRASPSRLPRASPSRSPRASPSRSPRASPSRSPRASPSRLPRASPSPPSSPFRSPGPSHSPLSQPSASPTLPSAVSPTPVTGFVYGPYIQVAQNLNWQDKVISTSVTRPLGQLPEPVTEMMPAGSTLTWQSAAGECGAEVFHFVESTAWSREVAAANVPKWAAAGLKYIVSLGGGESGLFTCKSDAGFDAFVQRFQSSSLVGFDLDTGSLYNAEDPSVTINQLVQRVKTAMVTYPALRWSWTLASSGAATGDNLDSVGQAVMKSLAMHNISWKSQFINLLPNNFGNANPKTCVVVNGVCDVALSAVNAVETLHAVYGVPYSRIELTPWIGGSDPQTGNVFSLANATFVGKYVRSRGLGGLHYLALDRDQDCDPSPWSTSSYCNSYGTAGTLGFNNAFSRALASP